jgi:hypothetical protein
VVIGAATTELQAEADRMAKNPGLSAYFNFERARLMLADLDRSRESGPRKAAAIRALVTARFIEWFSGVNAR